MTVRRIEHKEIRKVGRPGVEAAAPAGISPILRSSWKFAHDMAHRFSRELLSDRTKQFLSSLAKRFT